MTNIVKEKQNFSIEEREGSLLIVSKWLRRSHTFLFILSGIYVLGLLGGLIAILMSGDYGALLLWFFPALLGIVLVYYAIACLLNTTTIQAQKNSISIKTRPLHFFARDTQLTIQKPQKFYIKEEQIRMKNSYSTYYVLMCVEADNTHKNIYRWNEETEAQLILKSFGQYYHLPIE